jgi:hypothetical protein
MPDASNQFRELLESERTGGKAPPDGFTCMNPAKKGMTECACL